MFPAQIIPMLAHMKVGGMSRTSAVNPRPAPPDPAINDSTYSQKPQQPSCVSGRKETKDDKAEPPILIKPNEDLFMLHLDCDAFAVK